MSARRYPAYKPSGVEWLGEVPTHWEVLPLKHLAEIENGRDHKDIEVEEGYPVYGSGGQFAFASSYLYDGESVLLGRKGTIDRPLYVSGRFWTVDTMYWTCVRPTASARFLYYSALNIPFSYYSTNTALPSMTKSVLAANPLCVPPLAEQEAIAAFLDAETAKIDALVAEQDRLVGLLREKRQAVISHAVTRGLDPAAPMKPSGVEWLGEVPAHWEVVPIRLVARLESGHTPSRNHPEYWTDCKYPWFTLGDIWQVRELGRTVITETAELVSDLGLANSAARLLPAGTVMLSRTASVGFAAIMGVEMATTQDFANWVCGPKLASRFLLRCFHAMSGEFVRLKYGSTHSTIYMPDIQAMRIALPPLSEQEAIATFLDAETARIDALIAEADKGSALLKERRAALIAAAVTGQLDLRGGA